MKADQGGATPPAIDTSRKILFGFAEMPLQVASLAVLAYIPNFYGMDLGVNLSAVAVVLMVARIFDAVTDPAVGFLSDRTASRWGRRRVWMIASIPALMLAVYMLIFPKEPVTAGYLLGWMATLWLGWTMLQIPYYAWAAEISSDYHERSVIAGWRTAIGLVANILSKLVPAIAVYFFAVTGTRGVLELLGWILLAIIPVGVSATVLFVPERLDFSPVRLPLIRGIKLIWSNGPFKRLMLSFFLTNIGAAFGTTLFLFYVRAVIGEQSAGIVLLMVYYIVSLSGVSFWVSLSRKIGKHRALFIAYFSFWCCAGYMFLGNGDFYYILPIMVITGFCGSALWTLPNSMKADVIDIDTLRCGQNRAAWYFATWSFGIKLAQSIGPATALLLLSSTGFDSSAAATNTEDSLVGLRVLYSFGTPVFYSLAALVIWKYPLTEARQRRIRDALERRTQKSNNFTEA